MQKAPVIKGSGLKPLKLDNKTNEEVHVFGRNLEERVVAENEVEPSPITFESSQNHEDDDIETIRKRKFEALTGEEDEETVFQGEFKLFIWDLSTSNWIEKGRGQLKLNDPIDSTESRSRLIMRVSGTLRIILNVAIKSSFKVIANSQTNIRFTDGQNVWAASGSNSNHLKKLIEARIWKTAEIEEDKKKRTHHDDDDDYDDPAEFKKKKPDEENRKKEEKGDKGVKEGGEEVKDEQKNAERENDTEEENDAEEEKEEDGRDDDDEKKDHEKEDNESEESKVCEDEHQAILN